jgi:hypothetical protein
MTRSSRVLRSVGVALAACSLTLDAHAQRATALSTLEFSLAGMAARGIQLGGGRGIDAGVRWQPRTLRWVGVIGNLGVWSFDRTPLTTVSEYFYANNFRPGVTDYSLGASAFSGTIGPEISRPDGRARPYLHAMGGVSKVRVNGDYVRFRYFGFPGSPPREETFEPFPINERRATVGTLLLGAGVRFVPARGLRFDAGVRRSVLRSSSWMTDGSCCAILDQSGGQFPRAFEYTRRLDAWMARIGISYVP